MIWLLRIRVLEGMSETSGGRLMSNGKKTVIQQSPTGRLFL